MTTSKMLDPICDMIVDLAEARDQGLTMELADREFAFCGHGCLVRFAKSPQTYIPKVDAWLAQQERVDQHATPHAHVTEMPVIDSGMREWYASCRCCLSDAYPKVVETLDAERAAASQAPSGTGICDAAESNPA
jgi:YHS domain-containing protein